MKRRLKYLITAFALSIAVFGTANQVRAGDGDLIDYKPWGSGNCISGCTTKCGPLCDCCPLSICGEGCEQQ